MLKKIILHGTGEKNKKALPKSNHSQKQNNTESLQNCQIHLIAMNNSPKKRKANCVVEDSLNGGEAQTDTFEMLTNIVEEHIRSSTERIERLERSVLDIKKHIVTLTEKVKDEKEEDVSEISEFEESDVDESDNWMMMFRLLRDYRITNGHCKVTKDENSKLYTWIKNQKTFYTNTKELKNGTKLSNEKISKLESLYVDWGKKFPPPATWDEMFEQLKNFKERAGHCNVPFNATNPTPLGKWVAYQRMEYKRFKNGVPSLITVEQVQKLKEIKLSWKGPKL